MAKNILHMLFTGKHASPFDINMAVDAGFDVTIPFTDVETTDVLPLVQDSIFSRPPGYFKHTGMFIGGRDVNQTADMVEAAKNALVKPFEVSIFADPNGAYTTSAALIAMVEKSLEQSDAALSGSRLTVLGGGPVGLCALVLAARAGAVPLLARLTPASPEKSAAIDQFLERYNTKIEVVDAQTEQGKQAALEDSDVIVSTAKAGIEVLSADLLADRPDIRVAADVNAVPPAGIAGVSMHDKGVEVSGMSRCLGIGALAIGNVKYKTQQGLLKKMLTSEEAVVLDFPEAYAVASDIVFA